MEIKKTDVKFKVVYHQVRLGNGSIIYLPTSIPSYLQKFVNTDKLIQDKEMDRFKKSIKDV